jgi:hypothetical protein
MESSRGLVVVIVLCLILAVAGVAFLAGSGQSQAKMSALEPKSAAPSPEPKEPEAAPQVPPAAPKAEEPVGLPGAQDAGAPKKDEQDPETGLKPDPKLVVAPVQEPEVLLDAKVAERPDFVAELPNKGGFIFERRETGGKVIGVVVPGIVLVTRGLVELFGCGEGGKEHETVLRLECDVQSLDLALTSAGFKRGKIPEKGTIEDPKQGSRVIILVQWTDREGKTVTHRSEDLVVSLRRGTPMPRVGWTYVAQWAEVPDPANPKGEAKNKVLAAANSRSFVTTFRDKTALLDNPLEEAVDDTLFAANYMLLPRPGTPVRVIFRTPTEGERKDIGGLEKAIAKEAKDFKPDDREDQEKK